MPTVYLVPAGTDSAPGASSGDYLLRPAGGDLYEVGRHDAGCTWIGTLAASLLPPVPSVDQPVEGPDQLKLLAAVQGLESAQDLRGG
jgi:hypothetical protein